MLVVHAGRRCESHLNVAFRHVIDRAFERYSSHVRFETLESSMLSCVRASSERFQRSSAKTCDNPPEGSTRSNAFRRQFYSVEDTRDTEWLGSCLKCFSNPLTAPAWAAWRHETVTPFATADVSLPAFVHLFCFWPYRHEWQLAFWRMLAYRM